MKIDNLARHSAKREPVTRYDRKALYAFFVRHEACYLQAALTIQEQRVNILSEKREIERD